MKLVTLGLAAAFSVAATVASAGGKTTSCGCTPTPPSKQKVNSGVGNGAEYGTTEANDRDPGRSEGRNQAGKNSYKPNSAASARNMP